jgi:hypothetical protein
MGIVDPDKYKCPHTAFKKKCVDLRAACPKWVHLLGTNPQTGQPVDCFDCADQWASVLTIEAAKETRQAAAAIESFRNEMVRGQQAFLALATRPRLVGIGHGRDGR